MKRDYGTDALEMVIKLQVYNDNMDKKQFIELTGENPVDVLGQDWENEVEEYADKVQDQEQRWGEVISSKDQNE